MKVRIFSARQQGAALVLLYATLGAWWVEAVPPYESPDEPWHLAYAETLASGEWPSETDTYEAHQPGAYYLGVAAILRALESGDLPRSPANVFFPSAEAAHFHPPQERTGALAVLRTLTGFLAASAVALAWVAGRRLVPRRAAVANLAGLTVALLPQYQHIGHSVNNDAAAVVVGGAFVYLGVRAAAGVDRAVLVGLPVVAALAVVTKLTAWPAVAAPLFSLMAAARLSGREARRAALAMLAMAGAAALVALTARVTVPDTANAALADALRRGSDLDRTTLSIDNLWGLGRATLMSAWGRFGWLTVDLPTWLYLTAAVVVAAGAVSALVMLGQLPRSARVGAASALAACALAAAAWFRNLLADPQPQGRLMFGSLVAFALVLGLGYAGNGDRVRRIFRALPLATVLVASNVAALAWSIPRGFEPWRAEPPTVLGITTRPNAVVAARLSGEGAQATQTFVARGDAARFAIAVHRARGGGTALVRVVAADGTTVGSMTLDLDAVALNRWAIVEVGTHAPGEAIGAGGDPSRSAGAVAPVDSPSTALPGPYRAEISIVGGDGTLELWGAPDDDYPAGQLTVDGEPGTDIALVILGP